MGEIGKIRVPPPEDLFRGRSKILTEIAEKTGWGLDGRFVSQEQRLEIDIQASVLDAGYGFESVGYAVPVGIRETGGWISLFFRNEYTLF